jgi:hypothetical protein
MSYRLLEPFDGLRHLVQAVDDDIGAEIVAGTVV